MTERPGPKGLPPEEIIRRIKKALARDGWHSWETLVPLLKAGKAQIFWNDHGAWITEVIETPLTKVLNVWIVAGQLPGVMDVQPVVLDYARQQGCRKVIATARFGWKHVAKAHGWKEQAMMISHEVPGAPL